MTPLPVVTWVVCAPCHFRATYGRRRPCVKELAVEITNAAVPLLFSPSMAARCSSVVDEATIPQVFVESMMDTPNSGFALHGLAGSLRSLNRTQDAAQIEEVYKKAWENADGPLDSPCPSFSRGMSPALTRGGRKLSYLAA